LAGLNERDATTGTKKVKPHNFEGQKCFSKLAMPVAIGKTVYAKKKTGFI